MDRSGWCDGEDTIGRLDSSEEEVWPFAWGVLSIRELGPASAFDSLGPSSIFLLFPSALGFAGESFILTVGLRGGGNPADL